MNINDVKKKRLYLILIISLSFNLVFGYYLVKKFIENSTRTGIPITSNQHWQIKEEIFENMRIDTFSIVFLGNSITENFPLNEMINDKDIVNRGIAGDITEGILERLDPIVSGAPEKIFLMAGINDLKREISVDSVFKNYKKIILKILEKSPNTQLLIQSTLPVSKEYTERVERTQSVNEKVIKLNSKLKELAGNFGLVYIDLFKSLSAGNDLKNEFSVDGLHLNSVGYRIWKNSIMDYLH